MKKKLAKGTRVEFKPSATGLNMYFGGVYPPIGTKGSVMIDDGGPPDDLGRWVGVRWDVPFPDGHDLSGLCEFGYGYWVIAADLKLLAQNYAKKKSPFEIEMDRLKEVKYNLERGKVIKGTAAPKDGETYVVVCEKLEKMKLKKAGSNWRRTVRGR